MPQSDAGSVKLLLLGATGLVGSRVLALALANPAVSEVIAPTRQALPAAPRLTNPVAEDLATLAPWVGDHRPDAVVCALGTTQAIAGSKAAFRRVDHELPLAFARAAHAAGTESFAIVTALGASPTSRFFYTRTKGEVERDLRQIGFRSLTICRPSLIGGERHAERRAEGIALTLTRALGPVLPRRFRINPADVIAATLLEAAIAGRPGCRWIGSEAMN